MRFKTKYRFWTVFLVLLVVFILLGCVIIISNALYPNEAAMRELGSVPAHTYVIRYTEGFLFMVVFFYFTTNYYYNLFAQIGLAADEFRLLRDKDVVLFPRKINGKYAMLHRIWPGIQIVYFEDWRDLTKSF